MSRRKRLYIDFETRSCVELHGPNSVGLYNYANHPSTEVLMLAWAIDDNEVELWIPNIAEKNLGIPAKLHIALVSTDVDIVAFNSAFERYILQFRLGIEVPASRFQDPQASARYLSLPANLDDVSVILGLPHDMAKDKEGKRLIKLFCQPSKMKKKRGEEQKYYFKDSTTDPEDWKKFCDYCRQDVIAEREVLRRLGLLQVWPLPPKEREIWILDQEINDRGMPVDVFFVQQAFALGTRAKADALDIIQKLTGLENPNSNDQMLAWANAQGYKPDSLAKELVAAQLEYNEELTPLCREVLTKRKTAASTSYKKLATILKQVCSDGRIRNLFSYMGSSRCGRWSSNALQFHNMARPAEIFEDPETLAWARSMIYAGDYDAIELWFGKPTKEERDPGAVLSTIKSCIRTVFVAPSEKEFCVADENAIETRVAAWVSGCEPLLDVFRTYLCLAHPQHQKKEKFNCPECGKKAVTKDPYLDFAVKMTQIPYEILASDLKGKDPAKKAAAKRHRQVAKPGVLGCVYRLSGGELGMRDGVPTKFGLWGYAENMGVKMEQATAHEVVKVFRNSYDEICQFWYLVEGLIKEVLEGERVVRYCGPGDCIKIDKITIQDRDPLLRIQLPSGRYLHYMDASIQDTKMPWKQKDEEGEYTVDVYKPTFCYSGQDQKTKQWSGITSHGGKVFENIVQGIARDVLAHVLVILNNIRQILIHGHVHDEGIGLKDRDDFAPGLREMEWEMEQSIDWAPGLPLKGDGFECVHYHK